MNNIYVLMYGKNCIGTFDNLDELTKCKLIENNWNNEIVLTKKNINTIKKQLEEMR